MAGVKNPSSLHPRGTRGGQRFRRDQIRSGHCMNGKQAFIVLKPSECLGLTLSIAQAHPTPTNTATFIFSNFTDWQLIM